MAVIFDSSSTVGPYLQLSEGNQEAENNRLAEMGEQSWQVHQEFVERPKLKSLYDSSMVDEL